MRLTAVLGLLIFTIAGFWACQYSMEKSEVLEDNLTLKTLANQFVSEDSIFNFLAEEGFQYEFTSGAQIKIPKGALIHSNGQIADGLVDLSFREFRDAVDLLSAGVQMNNSNAMIKTAGAFSVKVEQSGEELFLDPTKNIEIKQACYEKDRDYDLFYLEPENHIRDSLFRVAPQINEVQVQLERKLRKMKPRIKFPLDENYFTFNYKGILDVIYNNDFTNVSHPMTQKKMAKYGLRWSSLNVEEFIDYNGKKELAALMVWKNISRKQIPDWIKDAKGTLQKIDKNRYRLSVTDEAGKKKFSTQLEAIIPLEELFSLGPGYWKQDYNTKIDKVEAGMKQLKSMPSSFRSFRINRFGVYNWLKKSDEMEHVKIQARFEGKKYESKLLESSGIYYLSGDRKGIMYYPHSEWDTLYLFDDPEAILFSILPNQEVLVFPNNQLVEIDLDQFEKMDNPSFLFKMKSIGQIPVSVEEFRVILQSELI